MKIKPIAEDKNVAAALATLAEKKTDLATLERQASEQHEKAVAEKRALQRVSQVESDAYRLLGHEVAATPSGSDAKYAELERDIRAHRRAIEIQQNVVADEVSRASAVVCKAALPQHKENVRRVAAALRELNLAVTAENDLRENLDVAGVKYLATIRPMGVVARLRNTEDVADLAERYAAEAKEYGLL